MNNVSNNEIRLKLLRLLQEKSKITQRDMNKEMGVSLGKINYCISAFAQKGFIKIERFKKAKKKSAYIYRLTPKGLEELATLTLSHLKMKIREYEEIKIEIKSLSKQVTKMDFDLYNDPELLEELKSIN